ncbi:tRNA (N(6)-L-threonylcarbamoyladenosine(37)-C(2))-methylthiotransferase MtaB [Deferribacter thermophilus]|uniref:tRNA (N(6)-L-threonylcarbamoyladenosine(37)-C(2))- methylthiotransferase MtaB n=1 Tax=Deferribacter thermophilus TaxID=53573 RepID=UPI003C1DE5C2
MNRLYIHTFGCKVNLSESENFKLESNKIGLHVVDNIEDADIVLINSCAVTELAEKKCNDFIKKVKNKYNPKIVITGCYASIIKDEIKNYIDVVIDNESKESLIENLKKHLNINLVSTQNQKLKLKTRAFLKIQDGCDAFCTYCIIPFLRGKPRSKPSEQILKEIDSLIEKNYKEIVLVGIHIGKYGIDLNSNLKELLKIITKRYTNYNIRFRLSSLDVDEIDDELVSLIANSKGLICNHLHIALQNGSNRILKLMKRRHTAEEFIEICKKVKDSIKDCTIGTDVIVGFPTETENDFQDTIDTLLDAKVDYLHVFNYSRREGTQASKMKNQIPDSIKKERAKKLRKLGEMLKKDSELKMIGKKAKILLESNGFGHLSNYHYVKVVNENLQSNNFYEIKILGRKNNRLIGGVIE